MFNPTLWKPFIDRPANGQTDAPKQYQHGKWFQYQRSDKFHPSILTTQKIERKNIQWP